MKDNNFENEEKINGEEVGEVSEPIEEKGEPDNPKKGGEDAGKEEISPETLPSEMELDSESELEPEDKPQEEQPLPRADTYEENPESAAGDIIADEGEAGIKDDIQKTKSREKNKNPALTFAIVMSIAFLITLLTLCTVILMGFWQTGSIFPFGGVYSAQNAMPTAKIADIYETRVIGIVAEDDLGSYSGSGFVLKSNGYIVTNEHVVGKMNSIKVYFADGRTFDAEYIGGDEFNDIAVIKIDAEGLDTVTLGDSDALVTGEKVVAIGSPAGINYLGTVTEGIVSFPQRLMRTYNASGLVSKSIKVIQTDAMVNHGNSGGPLINSKGEVVGIVSMRLENGYIGMGFALPINTSMNLVNDIIRYGKVLEGTEGNAYEGAAIGITGRNVKEGTEYFGYGGYYSEIYDDKGPKYIIDDNGDKYLISNAEYDNGDILKPEVSGVYVYSMTEGFDASSKFKVADIIVEADGNSMSDIAQIRTIVSNKRIGESIRVKVYRDGEYVEFDVVLGKAE